MRVLLVEHVDTLRTMSWLVLAALLAVLGGCAGQSSLFGGSAIVVPAPDGTACYDRRRAFYEAGSRAVSAEENRQQLQSANTFINSSAGRQIINGIIGSRGSSITSNLRTLLTNLANSANRDSELIAEVGSRFGDLVRCRQAEVVALRRDARARVLSREEARERAETIRQYAVTDAVVARDVNARLRGRTQLLQADLDSADVRLVEEPEARGPILAQRRAEIAQVRRTVQTNQRALEMQATSVDASVSEASFNVSDAGAVQPGLGRTWPILGIP